MRTLTLLMMLAVAPAAVKAATLATAVFFNTLESDAQVTLHPDGGGTDMGPFCVPAFESEMLTLEEGYYDIDIYAPGHAGEHLTEQWIGDEELDGGYRHVID